MDTQALSRSSDPRKTKIPLVIIEKRGLAQFNGVKTMIGIAAVQAANQRFYRAFETLDIEQMRRVWDDEYEVTCVHPGWPLVQGTTEVMQSWASIFQNTMVMQFTITEGSLQIEGNWAWVVCTESLRSVVDGRVSEGKIEATNIFRKRGERWMIVHHHGSPVMG